METKTIVISVISGIIILAGVCLFLASYFSKGKRKGRSAERKMAKVIKKLGKDDKVRIMNNVYLPLYGKTCEIDHLVFGRFGVLVVETKGISGTVSGSGKNLTHQIGSNTYKLYNPLLQNKTHMDNVTHHLKKGGFENVPVMGAVVFTDKDIELKTHAGSTVKEFKNFYKSLTDVGCNQDILLHYFRKIQVKDPIRRLTHKLNRKDRD